MKIGTNGSLGVPFLLMTVLSGLRRYGADGLILACLSNAGSIG
jgi:hypothetical protein